MLRPLHGLEKPKHKEAYVILVKGYFGDGDEFFTEEISSNDSHFYIENVEGLNGEDIVENYFRAYTYFNDNWVEERSELPEEYRKYIHGASWDNNILPSGIDEITLYYYNDLGQPNDVEVS